MSELRVDIEAAKKAAKLFELNVGKSATICAKHAAVMRELESETGVAAFGDIAQALEQKAGVYRSSLDPTFVELSDILNKASEQAEILKQGGTR